MGQINSGCHCGPALRPARPRSRPCPPPARLSHAGTALGIAPLLWCSCCCRSRGPARLCRAGREDAALGAGGAAVPGLRRLLAALRPQPAGPLPGAGAWRRRPRRAGPRPRRARRPAAGRERGPRRGGDREVGGAGAGAGRGRLFPPHSCGEGREARGRAGLRPGRGQSGARGPRAPPAARCRPSGGAEAWKALSGAAGGGVSVLTHPAPRGPGTGERRLGKP